ncbi:MAG TPA: ATP-dependent DNA ligase [Candidatus Dormibacteraeota bacterium]|nr:ATP-dependent DNA ligase [Candidatus Dormibacteraeota bacterium]
MRDGVSAPAAAGRAEEGATGMRAFSATADAIAATSSKLAKVRALAAYLVALDRDRLSVATRWFAGRPFPASDPRVLQVGGAAMSQVLRELGHVGDEELGAAYRRHADPGDTALDVLSAAGHDAPDIDLLDVERGLDRIATTPGAHARTAAFGDLLARCDPVAARYVVKLVAGDMRIGLREGLVEDAIARAFDRDPALVQRADMLLGDLGECAVLAAADALATAAPRLFAPLRFMLASAAADAAEVVSRMGDEVWVEDKYDGIRCQLHATASRVALYSRDLKDVTAQFPEVARSARGVSAELILDGELLAVRDGHVLGFQELQTRLGRKSPPATLLERVPVALVAWDVLWIDGESLLDVPLRARRARLEALGLGTGFRLAHQEHARGAEELEQLFLDARARHNEGLMAKDPQSGYSPGRRGMAWLKLKKPIDTLDVVVVGAEWGHGKRHGVLSDVTFAVRDDATGELVTVGKAYTGLTDAEIAEMTRLLLDITVADQGWHRRVEPRIVLEVAFDSVQASRRHRSGYALRFPRILRWRTDKGAGEIDSLSKVAAIAEALVSARLQRVDPAD